MKALAFGSMLSLAVSGIAALPAQANSSGPLTLLPNGGTATGATYTSLIGAGLTLSSTLDVDKQATLKFVDTNADRVTQAEWAQVNALPETNDAERAFKAQQYNEFAWGSPAVYVDDADGNANTNFDGTLTGIPGTFVVDNPATIARALVERAAVDPLVHVYYLIENPDEADIEITAIGNVNTDGTSDSWYQYVPATGLYSATRNATEAGIATFTLDAGSVGNKLVTDEKKIAIRASLGSTPGNRTVAPLFIDAPSETSAVKVKVTSWADTQRGAGEIGIINNGEWKSATQEVTLLPAASVPVTTRMSATTDRTGTDLVATVTFGSNVNPFAVAQHIGTGFFVDGSPIELATPAAANSSAPVVTDALVSGDIEVQRPFTNGLTPDVPRSIAAGVITVTAAAANANTLATGDNLARVNALTGGTDLISGVYTARTVFFPASPEDIYIGARSAALDLRNGTNTTVTGAKVVFTKSNNVAVSNANHATVRATTKSLPVVGQILGRAAGPDGILNNGDDTFPDLKTAGVRVRATVTGGTTVDPTTEITVTGSTDKIVETGDSIVVFGFTDSNGQFPITINSTTGKNLDTVNVNFEALLSTGLYANGAGDDEDITWATATLQPNLEISPSEFLTGATINATFTAVDQFGVGMDQNTVGRISIRVDAYVDGVVKSATYSETKPTTNGAASFSFANFATAGSNQEIRVQTLNGSVAIYTAYYTVYNNVATSSIAVADVFSNRVQYVDYVVGKTSDAAVAKAATDAGVIGAFTSNGAAGQYATIVGTALDANNAGQPGVPVTIAAAGVLFHDAETKTIAKDSITVFSNGQGFFDVQALSQKVNAAGATVTITAGGKSATTKLRTFLPTTIDAKNLKFSWALPAQMVKNTTYSVVATLTDVWGNPLQTLKLAPSGGNGGQNNDAVTFRADGSIQVNGVASVARNFNATGQATVFVRSVTDIAGPGQFSAVLANLNYYTGGASSETGAVTTVASIYTDTTTTTWNEASWSDTLSVVVDVLDRATVTGKVNVGSFNGKLVVYAADLAGARISWKVGGNWGTAIAQGNTLNRFDRPTPRRGVTVSVEIYVNGVKQLTKSVVTR